MSNSPITESAATPSASATQVEMILSQIDALPTLSNVAVRLLEITTDDASNASEVVSLLEADQSLTARILAVARRANIGTDVQNIERAVAVLGFDAIRNLVLSVEVFETFSQRVESAASRFDRTGFWKHSLATACAARSLVEAANGQFGNATIRAEEAFVCGLLHDIGKLALDACFPKSYDRVIARVQDFGQRISDAERTILGLDHTVAGRRLASCWRLPEAVRESIWLHHHGPASLPQQLAHPRSVQIVHLADLIARQIRVGYSGTPSDLEAIAPAAKILGIASTALEQIQTQLPEQIEQRAHLIGLDQLTSRELYQEAISQANAELCKANDTLTLANRHLEQRSRCLDALRIIQESLTAEAMLDDIARAGLRAVAHLFNGRQVGLLCWSQADEPAWLFCRDTAGQERTERFPLSMISASELSAAPAWSSARQLPSMLLDQLANVLREPPAWIWPISYQNRSLAQLIVAGSPPAVPEELIHVLTDSLGIWLQTAENQHTTRRLNEELLQINEKLVASQGELTRIRSIASVGHMAAGAAHEMNNPLAVISGRAQLLMRKELPTDVQRAAEIISDHAHRASAIVNELMEFAKPPQPEPVTLNMAALLGEIRREWLDKKILTDAQFILEVSDELPPTRLDAAQIKRLFDEVIRNAIEAMQSASAPLLHINCRHDVADDKLVIRIDDNGCGMSSEVVARAMDPFFSHRSAGRGRGMGLARAARFAEINAGRIRLVSHVGEGTSVFVELPVAPV